jgi:hypothetical protein
MHLVGCISGLQERGFSLLAAMVGVFTPGDPTRDPTWDPTLLIIALPYVLVPLLREQRLPWALSFCRAIHEAPRWNMVEVLLLGVLVRLLKLGNLTTFTPGPSFCAVVWLTVSLIAAVPHRPRRTMGTTGVGAAMTGFDIGRTLHNPNESSAQLSPTIAELSVQNSSQNLTEASDAVKRQPWRRRN